jgi:hypothetical protein
MKQKSLVVTGLLVLLALILFAMVGCEPVKIFMIDPTPISSVRKRIIYQDYYDTHGFIFRFNITDLTIQPRIIVFNNQDNLAYYSSPNLEVEVNDNEKMVSRFIVNHIMFLR